MLPTVKTKTFIQKDGSVHESFSIQELNFIKDHYPTHEDKWIAEMLGRSKDSIMVKRYKLGWNKYKAKSPRNIQEPSLSIMEQEIMGLVHFIETTSSDVLREIANTRRKELIKNSKR